MSGKPDLWRTPFRYFRWASHEKPAIFWSCVGASLGPISLAVVPPIRHRLGDPDREKIPLTYPSKFITYYVLLVSWAGLVSYGGFD